MLDKITAATAADAISTAMAAVLGDGLDASTIALGDLSLCFDQATRLKDAAEDAILLAAALTVVVRRSSR